MLLPFVAPDSVVKLLRASIRWNQPGGLLGFVEAIHIAFGVGLSKEIRVELVVLFACKEGEGRRVQQPNSVELVRFASLSLLDLHAPKVLFKKNGVQRARGSSREPDGTPVRGALIHRIWTLHSS